eukprot:3324127-Amphidinium_carterae.2
MKKNCLVMHTVTDATSRKHVLCIEGCSEKHRTMCWVSHRREPLCACASGYAVTLVAAQSDVG